LIAWAQARGHKEVVSLLQQTLDEEKKADKLLNDSASSRSTRARPRWRQSNPVRNGLSC
jgi:ferritin-like metal-binding protein YciE